MLSSLIINNNHHQQRIENYKEKKSSYETKLLLKNYSPLFSKNSI